MFHALFLIIFTKKSPIDTKNQPKHDQQLLLKTIKSLPNYGIITFDSNTNYWYIKLPNEWQNVSSNLAELSQNFVENENNSQYLSAVKLCKTWSSMLLSQQHDDGHDNNDTMIECVTPPSIAGL